MDEDAAIQCLLRDLESAFGMLSVPGKEDIVGEYCAEGRSIQAHFEGHHWRDLSVEDLRGQHDSLCLFSPTAFRFYLPAFIRASVLDEESTDLALLGVLWSLIGAGPPAGWERRRENLENLSTSSGVPHAVFDDLFRGTEAESSRVKQKRWGLLNTEQREVVLAFVAFLQRFRKGDFLENELEEAEAALRAATVPDGTSEPIS